MKNKELENEKRLMLFPVIILIFSPLSICILLLFYFILLDTENKKNGNILLSDTAFIKPLSDDRQYRVVRFANKLDAVIISDPHATKSAASLSVGAGSFYDDPEATGLAHLCEHMLFLGSKSFPKAGDFEDFLISNSGNNNAFTEMNKTTYFFEVDNPGFNTSLRMFSRMFAEPMLDIASMNKEIDSVNSEHENHYNDDMWREHAVIKAIVNPLNPFAKFSTGNSETLRAISLEELNSLLKRYYMKYYTSDNMKVALVSNYTLDEMQSLLAMYFSDMKFNISDTNENKFYQATEPVFRKCDLGSVLWYHKLSEGSHVDILFQIDSVMPYYKTKPMDYMDYLLKYSGERSLLAFLKKRKLASSLNAKVIESYRSFALYTISVALTDEGLREIDLVIRLVFNYINLIRSTKVSMNIYEEIRNSSEMSFKFLEKSQEYTFYLAGLSRNMFDYDYSELLYGEFVHSEYDETVISKYMDQVSPSNSIIIVGSTDDLPEHKHKFFKCSSDDVKVEKYYQTEYIVAHLDMNYINQIAEYPVNFWLSEHISTSQLFTLRSKNMFISNLKDFVHACNTQYGGQCHIDEYDIIKDDLSPIAINDDLNFKAFYKIDKTFKQPITNVFFKLVSDKFQSSPLDFLYIHIMFQYLQSQLDSALADAVDFGNGISYEISDTGMYFLIESYSDLTYRMMQILAEQIFILTPDKEMFNEMKELAKIKLEKFRTSMPHEKNTLYFNKIIKLNYTLDCEMIELIPQTNYDDFLHVFDNVKHNAVFLMLIYGSIQRDDAEKVTTLFKNFIPKVKLTENQDDNFILNSIHLQRRIHHPMTFTIKNPVTTEANHAVSNFYQIGEGDLTESLYLNIIEKCIGNIFYNELRTSKQLGYIVQSDHGFIDTITYFRIDVQGSKESPEQIDFEIDRTLSMARNLISKCSGNFDNIIESLREKLKKKDDNLLERSKFIWRELDRGTCEYNKQKLLMERLSSLKYVTLVKFFNDIFFDNPKRFAIHNYAGNYMGDPVEIKTKPYFPNSNFTIVYTDSFSALNAHNFIQNETKDFEFKNE